jgi:hypothetical protein
MEGKLMIEGQVFTRTDIIFRRRCNQLGGTRRSRGFQIPIQRFRGGVINRTRSILVASSQRLSGIWHITERRLGSLAVSTCSKMSSSQIPDNLCEDATSSEVRVEAEAFKSLFKDFGVELSTEGCCSLPARFAGEAWDGDGREIDDRRSSFHTDRHYPYLYDMSPPSPPRMPTSMPTSMDYDDYLDWMYGPHRGAQMNICTDRIQDK